MNNDITARDRLNDLLEYVHHVGMLNQRPIFRIDEYKQLVIWEHELKGRIGIQHNTADEDGVPIWVRVERLKRVPPPEIPEQLREWIVVSNEPMIQPDVKEKIIKTITESEAKNLITQGIILEADIKNPLKEQHETTSSKDIIIRLKNNISIKSDIENYIDKQWLPWAEEEKPRRKTIKIYDSLFSLQQTIEAQGDEQPIELIWGIGIARWNCEGHDIDHALIEKPIEIEINREDGSILIHPRNIEPILAVDSFSALDNPGVNTLIRFGKKHFSELSEDVEFSPYVHESFEPILRQASTYLSEKGTYWPDVNPDKENRKPNKIGDTFEITDSWVMFARPRSRTGFVQDIERFQKKLKESPGNIPKPAKRIISELSDVKPVSAASAITTGSGSSLSSSPSCQKAELFFPKPFNDAQVQIVYRLEQNDGVVVQGPPGTGKTHTIANIICHYLATGKTVLVTSKGEPALSVLQKQIPEALRPLTISLLTNERQGMKQLESAVQLLAGIASQTNLRDLKRDAESHELRVKQLKKEIEKIDGEIKEWGLKQLTPINKALSGTDSEITAMELAEQVISDTGRHEWLIDELGSSEKFIPQFTDSDIASIRSARRTLGEDISYVGKRLPNQQDMLDSANIAAIHDDVATAARIEVQAKNNNIPPLAVSVEKSVNRAKKLISPLKGLQNFLTQLETSPWLEGLFYHWLNNQDQVSYIELFNELRNELSRLVSERQKFVRTLVEANDPASHSEQVLNGLDKLIAGKKPFGLLSFGNKEAKKYIELIRVDGEEPKNTEQWQLVKDYILFQNNIRKFTVRWNHAGQELDLPNLSFSYGELFKTGQSIHDLICKAEEAAHQWEATKKEISTLFPHGVAINNLLKNKTEIEKVLESIDVNTSRISLGAQRIKLQDLTDKIKNAEGEVSVKLRNFIQNSIGNPGYSSDEIMKAWQNFIAELNRLNKLSNDISVVERISEKILSSGAPNWAKQLRTEPVSSTEDELTPVDWLASDKQVSPTAAFIAEEKILQLKHNFLRGQPFAELLLPGVSIYDLANAVFPGQRIMLTEHFRCVEPIIRFSMQFYSESLNPLRIPTASEKLTPPLIDVHVKHGRRDERNKINEDEAEAIVSEIKRIVNNPKYSGRTIGVISLVGAQQAKFIQNELLIALGEDSYQKYHIACGDAATFQGKERDIILLSMVVGAGQGAAMTKREYEQRTNVALSRARDRMYLFRSVEESDLKNEADLRLRILQHFVNPMPQRDAVNNPLDLCDSGFERDVLIRLIEKGYNVTPQVKVGAFSIDMVVEGENDRRLAIELDGDKYHPPEKWMEDWQRQRVMERVGWKFWRCWGSSYTVDPEGCIDDLINTLDRMQILPGRKSDAPNIYTEQRIYPKEAEQKNS
ncbi:AAA domain-containing protein [Desulfobacter postgatei]|uniref:AAA domain-containing protein n=1 Tax=Desulfobacter postgatei TaxID=2293 RepID=UPI002A366A38|nr:AAA domain-containing protein [Desulfobacter postgatei]MDX9963131.1 AAA domain-containing protein [Desulfobacter postgatei]